MDEQSFEVSFALLTVDCLVFTRSPDSDARWPFRGRDPLASLTIVYSSLFVFPDAGSEMKMAGLYSFLTVTNEVRSAVWF